MRTALVTNDQVEISASALTAQIDQIAKLVPSRSLVFHLTQNTPDSIAAYCAFQKANVVQLLLGERLEHSLLKNLIQTYQPTFLFLPKFRSEDLQIQGTEVLSLSTHSLVYLKPSGATKLHDSLSLLLTTSGSTGSPKLVRLSAENLRSNAESIAQYLEITDQERPITTLPFNYAYGLSVINSHLLQGSTLILTQASVTEPHFWKLLKESKATSFAGVPYLYEVLKKFRFDKMDLPHLKTLTQAGGKLSESLITDFANYCFERGKRFFVMYGQTEATARMAYLPHTDARTKPGSIGIAIPGGQFSLESDGELIYRGKNVSLGYAETAEDLALGDLNQGILKTGDIASQDPQGYFSIIGRKSRFLKIFGLRISLAEVENLLQSTGLECACTGKDDLLKVYMTDAAATEKALQLLVSKTGIHPSAIQIKAVPQIPRNEFGKVLYSKLEDLL